MLTSLLSTQYMKPCELKKITTFLWLSTKTANSFTIKKSDSPLTKLKKRRPLVAGQSAVDIVPYTENQIKRDCKYKRHKCKMAEVMTTRLNTGQDACKPGKPAELAVDKVKLHYVVHYINRGAFNHLVPEEGDREGKIDFYTCNVCPNKRFKNHLERAEYPGRGSVLCHIATDHGRLLKAMLDDDDDMEAEIKALAKYDKQFNEQYRAYIDNDDNSFGMPDNRIVNVKESLIWKYVF
jgi:hypothetical protein